MQAAQGAGQLEGDPMQQDWRIWLGGGLSHTWLVLGGLYISYGVGFEAFANPDVIGGFLEGGFAPLAFLWLVIGFFLQQRELTENTRAIRAQYREMRRTAENAELQARAIQANELHARQDTFMDIAAMVQRQLGGVAGLLYVSIVGQRGSRTVSTETTAEMWARASGDPELFSRSLLGLHFNELMEGRSSREILLGGEVQRTHADLFIQVFERLIRSARACDPEEMIASAILGSPNGLLYRVLLELRDGIPAPDYSPR